MQNFCKPEIFYEGLNSELTSVFSCHECRTAEEIPVAGVRLNADDKIIGLRQYGSDFKTYRDNTRS